MGKQFQFDCKKILGKGEFSTVFEGVWKGTPVAVKRVRQIYIKERKNREDYILRYLDHPNVVKLLRTENDTDFR